jgi:two-component system nitrogen regulation sensor histidine kinase NtrY
MGTSAGIKVLILFILGFTMIALIITLFYVLKNLIKLFLEKRKKVTGFKFRTKIVATFVTLTLIPSAILFMGAGGILTAYIDKLFDPQIRQPLEDSLALSKTFYEVERKRTINKARKVIRGEIFRDNITVRILTSIPENASETIRGAFEGKEGTEVISMVDGDIIRAVIPEVVGGKVKRVFVAESVVPSDIVMRINNIRLAHETYTTVKKLKLPLKLNYLLILAFITSLIVFVAMWVSLKISKGITDPIGTLARATEDIAAGNLEVNIDIKRDDEIGMLVNSFNRMVKEVRESRESLQNAYLKAERERLFMESIVENIDSGVISLDENRKILTINTTASQILHIDPVQVVGKDYNVLFNHLDSPELTGYIKGIRLNEFTSSSTQIKVNISGKNLILRVFIAHLRDEENRTLGILVVFEDMTEILKAHQALAWQEVAKRMAHEIKNPLTPIKLSAERILKKWRKGDDDFGKIIEGSTAAIIREAASLQRLVNEFSRLGRMPHIQKEPTDIVSLIEEALSIYGNYETRLRFHAEPEIPAVEVDREQFKRVIVNLVDNAYKALNNDGGISITAAFNQSSRTVKIEVADEGMGIRDEDKEKLFLPYFSTREEGTGLGLTIVHRIVTEHGGTISVSDNKPAGTVFTIELPAGDITST